MVSRLQNQYNEYTFTFVYLIKENKVTAKSSLYNISQEMKIRHTFAFSNQNVSTRPTDESCCKSCCQPGPTELSINGSLMPEKDGKGKKGHTRPGEEDCQLVNVPLRKNAGL